MSRKHSKLYFFSDGPLRFSVKSIAQYKKHKHSSTLCQWVVTQVNKTCYRLVDRAGLALTLLTVGVLLTPPYFTYHIKTLLSTLKCALADFGMPIQQMLNVQLPCSSVGREAVSCGSLPPFVFHVQPSWSGMARSLANR